MGTSNSRDYYEIRTYTFKDKTQLELVESHLENTAIPELNRLGISSVGVFQEIDPSSSLALYMLIPYQSMDDLVTRTSQNVPTDDRYASAPITSPAYDRIRSSLLVAFEGMPRIEIPQKKSRIFELRQYESHSELKAKKKIEMFNSAEIDLFHECGLTPVFFGETLIGEKMPNLTYMLVFDDIEDQKERWQAFIEAPAWKELSGQEEFKDTVSNITKTNLVPTRYSQV